MYWLLQCFWGSFVLYISFFFLIVAHYTTVWLHRILFIHSPENRHVDHFQFGAIINNVAYERVNSCICVDIHVHFSLGGFLGVKLLGLNCTCTLNLLQIVSFPKWLYHCIVLHFYWPYGRVTISLKPWQQLVLPSFESISHSSRCQRYFIVVLLCISLMTNAVTSFHTFIWHLHIFIGKCLSKFYAYLNDFLSSYYWLVRILEF